MSAPVLPKSFRAAQIPSAGAKFQINEIPLPPLNEGEVLIKVEACGICHSDTIPVNGYAYPVPFPITPGHEVVGTVVAVDKHAKRWKVGDRVGAGWHGGHCFECNKCLHGDFNLCDKSTVHGVLKNGGFAEYFKTGWEALARVPQNLSSEEAAPLMCAGITVFNSLRKLKALPGSLVAVLGIGGLGHLAIQFANKCGYRVVAISTSDDKKELAKELGAHHYINSKTQNVAQELTKLGGARVVLATAFSTKAMEETLGGLGTDGVLVCLGIDSKPLEIPIGAILPKRASVLGWPSGNAMDSEETLQFAELTKVKPYLEQYPFEKVQEAYDRMLSNQCRFRVVLTFKH